MGDVVTVGIFHRNIIAISELKTCTGEGSRQAQLLLSTSSVSQQVAAMLLLFLRCLSFSTLPRASRFPVQVQSRNLIQAYSESALEHTTLFLTIERHLSPNMYIRCPSKGRQNDWVLQVSCQQHLSYLQSYSTKPLCLGVKQKMFMTQKKTISPVPFEISISNSAALLQHVLNL